MHLRSGWVYLLGKVAANILVFAEVDAASVALVKAGLEAGSVRFSNVGLNQASESAVQEMWQTTDDVGVERVALSLLED